MGFCGEGKAWHNCELSWKVDAGVERGKCQVLDVSSLAQHPPGGHWYVVIGIGVLQPSVGVPQEPLVLLKDLFWGTDSVKQLLVLNFLVGGREGLLEQCCQGKGQSCKGQGPCESWGWGLPQLSKWFIFQH